MTEHNITNNQSDYIMTESYIINNQSERSNESYDAWVLVFQEKQPFARSVFVWTLSVVEIPIMLFSLYALCFLIKSRTASVFVIHLILSDLIQLICLILMTWDSGEMLSSAHEYSLIVDAGHEKEAVSETASNVCVLLAFGELNASYKQHKCEVNQQLSRYNG
ncbi:hypothetical protein E1301_Tti023088 [Triplophysa tibetana]|uniref:Protein ARV n=1 Tax=Triplophysa tibetana TaxID=1572043 RepID=A0A5A9NF09_9TELE|nr:hypothetical protein E1301_Tti023088 [Triplophysa tibetana]